MDNLVFEESITTNISDSPFVDKQWIYTNDSNNSSYSGSIVFDTTSLSNSAAYLNYSEAFLMIPLVLQMDSTSLTVDTASDWGIGLKNGFWQLIHSISCEYNNNNIITQTPFINIWNTFKAMTSWSPSDLKNFGCALGFSPDSSLSWVYSNVASSNAHTGASGGFGLQNNRVAPYVHMRIIAGTATSNSVNINTIGGTSSGNIRSSFNQGLQDRIRWLNYSVAPNVFTNAAVFHSNKVALLGDNAKCSTIFQSYSIAIAGTRALVFPAIIRLKDICSFFGACPMIKGGTIRLYINTNQSYFTGSVLNGRWDAASAAQAEMGALTITSIPIMISGGGTCPVMVGSSDIGQPLYNINPLTVNTTAVSKVDFKVGLSIVKNQFTSQLAGTLSAPITTCRLYCAAYTMSAMSEQRYLSLSPTKTITYTDVFYSPTVEAAAGTPFQYLITNGISNIKSVLVVPLLATSSNGVVGAGDYTGIIPSTLMSPFCSTGGTPDPISITNFQIAISGKNLFQANLQYTFEQFLEQTVSSNQLNGSLTTSLASGLIGLEDFQYLYKYLYGNVSRCLPSEVGVAKSVMISGTNNSSVPCTFAVFVEYEKQITIDIRTGARIE